MSSNTNDKIYFLSNYIKQVPDIVEVGKMMYDYKMGKTDKIVPLLEFRTDAYNYLTKRNVNKYFDQQVKTEYFQDYLLDVYKSWRQTLSAYVKKQKDKFKPETVRVVSAFLNNAQFDPANMTGADCERFFIDVLTDKDKSPFVVVQNGKTIDYSNDLRPLSKQIGRNIQKGDFIHVRPFCRFRMPSKNIECRLYLNLHPNQAMAVGRLLTEKCRKTDTALYYKFWTKANDRNDSFLVYTTYKDAPYMVDCLNKIRSEHPKLFYGAKIGNPMHLKVNDYIGFAEEPQHQHSSFGSEVGEAFDEFYKAQIATSVDTINVDEAKRFLTKIFVADAKENVNKFFDVECKGLVNNAKLDAYMTMRDALEGKGPYARTLIDSIKEESKFRLSRIKTNDPSMCFDVKAGKYVLSIPQNTVERPYCWSMLKEFGKDKQIKENITKDNLKPHFLEHHLTSCGLTIETMREVGKQKFESRDYEAEDRQYKFDMKTQGKSK